MYFDCMSYIYQTISLHNENGKRNNNIRIESFRYGHNIWIRNEIIDYKSKKCFRIL